MTIETKRYRVFYPVEYSGVFLMNVIDAENDKKAMVLLEETYPKGSFLVEDSKGYWYSQYAGFKYAWSTFTKSPEYERLVNEVSPELTEKQRKILKRVLDSANKEFADEMIEP